METLVRTYRTIVVVLAVLLFIGSMCIEHLDDKLDEQIRISGELEGQVMELEHSINDYQDMIEVLEDSLATKYSNAAAPLGSECRFYDIKLSKELQLYTWQCCEYFGVDYELFLSLMHAESTYNIDSLSTSNDNYVGLVQMGEKNVPYIEKALGRELDIYNPYDNILAGVYWLSRYTHKYPDNIYMQLMCYNMGEARAKKYDNKPYYDKIYNYYLTF